MQSIITYKLFGGEGPTCQKFRIESGLNKLGCQESDLPDFIYANDAGVFDQAIEYKKNVSPSSYLILCLLDIPEHIIQHYDLQKVKSNLLLADKIVCISNFVKSQIKQYFDLDSEVIYNPVQDIYPDFPDDKYSKFTYLFAGRSTDPNKRNDLGRQALININANPAEVLSIGPEYVGFGVYGGVLSPKELHKVYNSVKIVFCLGRIEGLGLQKFETLCGNSAIPIVLNDESTYLEFFEKSKEFLNIDPNPNSISDFILKMNNYDNFNYTFEKLREIHLPFINQKLRPSKVAESILSIFNINNSRRLLLC